MPLPYREVASKAVHKSPEVGQALIHRRGRPSTTDVHRFNVPSALCSFLLTTSFVIGFATQAAAQIRRVDLGTLGGSISLAAAINASGQIVGESETAQGVTHAFSWTSADGMIDLGVLPGFTSSSATAVNGRGMVVGYSAGPESPNSPRDWCHAFSWTATEGMIDLGTLPGFGCIVARAVNNDGLVAGEKVDSENNPQAFSWTKQGGIVALPALGGLGISVATAVNARGDVVGYCSAAGGVTDACLWPADGRVVNLGHLGGGSALAYAVSDSGQVVGVSYNAAPALHAFSWTENDGMIDLGTFGGEISGAYAVNAHGQVVGHAQASNGEWHAFSWTAAGGMIDLLPHNFNDTVGVAINARGQVVGDIGGLQAFSWTAGTGVIDLGTLGSDFSRAFAVNEDGWVVGYSDVGLGLHATLWQTGGAIRPAVADAYVQAGASASKNFGAATTLRAKKGLSTDYTRRGLVKFDISDVQTIGKATLRLHGRVSDARNRRVRAGIFRVGNQSWDEQTVTWSTKPAYGPLIGIVTVRGTAPQWVEIDVTAFAKAEQQAGQHTISLALRALEHTSPYASFDSRESGALGPQLVITPQ